MKYRAIIVLVVVAAAVAGCGKGGGEEGQAMPVNAVVAKAVNETVMESVDVIGSLSARNEVTILSELDSTVREISIKEGQKVKSGDVLFRLDDVKTKAKLFEAEAAFKLAELSHKRNADLLKKNTISQQAYDVAEADLGARKAHLELARDEQSKSVITAPFDGMVGEKRVSIGQYVSKGAALLSLVGMDPLEISGEVPERYAAALKSGLKVQFTTEAYNDKKFAASVVYVSPSVDTLSRTVRVKAEVPNGEGLLKPGMFGKMTVVLEEREGSLVIPEGCIQRQGAASIVVRVNEQGLSEMAPVTTGKRFKGRVEVLSGLKEGDKVVVEGWQKMPPGSLVIATPKSKKYGVEPAQAPAPEESDDNL